MNIDIAGVSFVITCRDSAILQEPPAAYMSFVTKNGSFDEHINISLDFALNSLPDVKKMKKIFDTGQSWALFQNGAGYFIILCPPASDKIVWAAQFDRDVNTVTIFPGEHFVRQGKGIVTVSHPVFYPLDQILLMYFLARKEGALIHAAGVEYNGRGFIFPGRSGAGKSTLSRQLAACNKISLLSDDRVVVRKTNDTFKAFGTPWAGEGGIAINKHVPLSGIFFISHAGYNEIEEIKPRKALEKLLPVVSIPWYDPEVLDKVLLFCDDLISSVPAYDLSFKPGVEIADVFEKFVSA